MDLFDYQATESTVRQRPLAERMRPHRLMDLFGQDAVAGPGSLIRHAIENDRIFSMILWGPPGCGKTTLAHIIARETRSHFIHFSAVLSGVKQIREVIDEANKQRQLQRRRTLLFVDEIHRFNKAQQDAFLHQVESGLITLIGATTENPSFEVIAPLLSRCRVITLSLLDEDAVGRVLDRAMADKLDGLGDLNLGLAGDAREHLIRIASGTHAAPSTVWRWPPGPAWCRRQRRWTRPPDSLPGMADVGCPEGRTGQRRWLRWWWWWRRRWRRNLRVG